MRCQLFLGGTVFPRFLLLSADAEAKTAPCVPGSGVQGLLTQEFPFPSTLCSAHRRLLNLPTEWEVILVLSCAVRAPRAEPASHITLCWVMHEEGGQEVLCCDSYCALETWAGRVIPFPVYLFTSSFPVTVQDASMFGKMYFWKKKKQKPKTCFLASIYRPKISSSVIYIHKIFLDQLISQQGMEAFL